MNSELFERFLGYPTTAKSLKFNVLGYPTTAKSLNFNVLGYPTTAKSLNFNVLGYPNLYYLLVSQSFQEFGWGWGWGVDLMFWAVSLYSIFLLEKSKNFQEKSPV